MSFAKGSCLMAALCVAWCGFAQTSSVASQQSSGPPSAAPPSTPAKVEMPSDPAALLALAAKVNGLQNAGTEPWHLKATYQLLDGKGGVKETGTFEEWWVSDKKYKKSYTSPSFTQTDFSNDSGSFRIGASAWPNAVQAAVQRAVFPAFADQDAMSKFRVSLKDKTVGGASLKCVTLDRTSPVPGPPSEVHCISPNAPIERIGVILSGFQESVYNGVVLFRGAYIARDVSVSRMAVPLLHVHLDVVESLTAVDASTFVAPAGSLAIDRRIFLEATVVQGNVLRKVQPQYPSEAKAERVQGTVVLEAVIGRDGAISHVEPIGGPPMLIDPSLKAVRQWKYKPYEIDGEAVEVDTLISVVYSMGN